jgi:hypothetical protein
VLVLVIEFPNVEHEHEHEHEHKHERRGERRGWDYPKLRFGSGE